MSEQPASNADEDAAWAAVVRWREGVEAPLRTRIAEMERERDQARNLVQTWAELAAEVEVERDRARARVAELEPLAALGRAIVRGSPTWQRVSFTACILGSVTITPDTWYAAVDADKAALGKEAT